MATKRREFEGQGSRLTKSISMAWLGSVYLAFTGLAQAQAPQPIAAIHDSELTRALATMPATNGTPTGAGTTGFQWWLTNWNYFVMPDSVKEALRSDGTVFTTLGDSNIAAGQLVGNNGQPNYPILISLGSEAIADNEIGPLTNFVAAGGTLLVGGSAFTRNSDGTSRGDFALAQAMGIHMANASFFNWVADTTFSKLTNHALVAHIPGGSLAWNLPVSADEISWGVSPSYQLSQGHLVWQVQNSNALAVAQGDVSPYLLVNSFGKGTIIYIAALEPFLTHGGNAPGMYSYGILRNAIEGAFGAFNLPVPKLSPWPFAYAAALEVRHDFENFQDQITDIANSAQFEFANGAKGDYYFCTGTLRVEMTNSPSAIAQLCAAVTNYGATIGPHNGGLPNINNLSLVISNYDYWHWGTDEGLGAPLANLPHGYTSLTNYAFTSLSNSFLNVEGWLGRLTNGLRLTVSPHFNATREASYQMQQQLGVKATGEQKIGPFPGWVLSTSTNTPDMRYSFISLPTSDWYLVPPTVAQSMESGFGTDNMEQMIDFYYNLGGLINLYSHSPSSGTGIAGPLASQYVTYSMAKPRIWPANAASIYEWWLARSNIVSSTSYSNHVVTAGTQSWVTVNLSGASDPRTAVEAYFPRPSVTLLQVRTNNILAGSGVYWTNGSLIKVQTGTTVTNVQVRYYLNPAVESNFYYLPAGGQLSVAAPGLLTNALPGAGANLSPALVGGPAYGSLTLTNDGSFGYTPLSNFTGMDTFTYLAYDTAGTSAVSRAMIDVTPPTDLFYDNFLRPTNADPLAPWVAAQGNWAISGGALQGSDLDEGAYDDAYVAGDWTNFSVQAQIQIPAGGFGAGLDGRVNPLNGAKYTVIVYPNGIPGETTSPLMRLLKFHGWQVLGPSPMQQVVLPPVGTNWHSLAVVFRTNEIIAYWDGTEVLSAVDNNFDGIAPFASGGIGTHFFTYTGSYVASFGDVTVSTATLAGDASYTTVQNQALKVQAPGVLANDVAGLGTNLTALLASGPTNGSLTFNANGSFTYTPATNFVGSDSFTYQASDGVSTSSPALVSITVISNAAPVANNDSYTYSPNSALTVAAPGVLGNDSSPFGAALTAQLVSGPASGALTLNANGSFTYVPATNFTGNDSFTYVASDGSADSVVATVTLSDPANGALYYDNFVRTNSSITPWVVESGTWAVNNGLLVGGPNGSGGTYGQTYLTNVWKDYSVQAQLQFGPNGYGGGLDGRVNATNGARYAVWVYPSGNDLNLIKFTNWTSFSILATLSLPPIGTNWHSLKLAMEGNELAVYYDGILKTNVSDNLSPFTSGGIGLEMYSSGYSYILSVSNVVVSPLAVSDSYLMAQNTALTIPATGILENDTGVYGTNLTASLVSGPSNGLLNLSSNGGFNYTPTNGFVGSDSFTYRANDPLTNLGTATVTIDVNPVHSGPTLPVQNDLTINELTTLEVTNTAVDTNVPPLALGYSLVNAPAGAVISANGIISWSPSSAQAPSTNVFTTLVTDNGSPSDSASNSFSVVVLDLNVAPVLPPQTNQTIAGLTPLVVNNEATEADPNSVSLVYALLDSPTNASISADGIITWTPVVSQVPSTNLFTTVVTDFDPSAANAQQLSATNSFAVTVAIVHKGPSLLAQANQTVIEPGTLIVTNTALDSDVPPTTLTYALIGAPFGAQISNNGIITWRPSPAQGPSTNLITTVVTDNGTPPLSFTNSFTAFVNLLPTGDYFYDNFARTNGSLAPWIVNSGNWAITDGQLQGGPDAPSTYAAIYITNSWTDYAVQAQLEFGATNAYGAGISGRLNPATGARYGLWIYSSSGNVHLWKFSNWTAASALTTLNIPSLVETTNSHILKLAFRGNEIAGYIDGILVSTYLDNSSPYTSGSIGLDMYTAGTAYQVSFANALVNPLALSDTYYVGVNSNLTVPAPGVLGNDTGVYGTNLTASLVAGPSNGSLNLNTNGGFTYTPDSNFTGTDSFSYESSDGETNLGLALVTIVVSYPSGPILPGQPNQTINELTTLVVTNTATDYAVPPVVLSYSLLNPPAGAAIDTNGIITWTPTRSESPSTNLITTVVSDNGTPPLSASNSFVVVVNDLNSTPVLPVQTNLTIAGLATLVVTNAATDADIRASLNYLLVAAPTNASISTNGIITWTPVASQVPSTNIITTIVSDYDPYAVNGQVLSATNSFTVVVTTVHIGPSLPVQNNQTINELATLEVTNTATDSDVPALALTYQLAVAPVGATISSSGIIVWTPSQSQAPSTNVFTTVVSDSGTPSLSATNSFVVVADDLNSPPALPVQTNFTITGLATLVVTNTAAEADIHSVGLNYSLISGPTNAVIDANGIITWTPVASQVPSTNVVTTLVSDYDPYAVNGQVLSATNTFTVVVLAVHTGPSLTSQNNQTINELATLEVTNTAMDSDIPALALSYQLVVAPVGATISSNGIIIWTPSQSQAPSTNVFTTVVSDSGTPSLSATNSFTVVVDDLNSAPVLPVQTNLTITGLATLVVTNTAVEADIHAVGLTYSLVESPTNAVIDTNGIIAWTPVISQVPSTNVFTTLVSDYDPYAVNAQVLSATNTFTVVVLAVHTGPSLTSQNNQTINELATLEVTNTATDSDIPALTLSYQLVVAPVGATISSNGIIIWTPSQSQAPSTNLFTTVVSDSGTPSLSSTNSFTVVVNDLNSAPVLPLQTNLTITGLSTVVVTNTAAEADIHSVGLTYSLVEGPTNAVIDTNGIITWTPVPSQVPSTNVITTLVSDYDPYAVNGQVLSATNTFTVVVLAVHIGPSLTSQNNQTINELATLEVTNTATDSDIPTLALSYELAVAPTGATISSNGIIIWTPSQAQAPSTNVFTTVVSDSGTPSLSATNSFAVVVNDLNSAPVLPTQTNLTISGLATLVVTNTAAESDIHSVSLIYILMNGPTNAVIDTNGIITWTPVPSQVPSTNVITTLVSDYDPNAVNGQVLSATNSFTVVVAAVHNGPGLTAQNNQTINELTTMVVINTATDSDIPVLALSYQLAVAPAGATISSNGIIVWTPNQSQAPSTNVFTTIVSDSGTPSLSATNSFTVVVDDLNSPPVLPVQTNFTIAGLASLAVTNTAAEADIHSVSLTYSLMDGPTNAVIDTNGIITWTPVTSQVPSTNVITTLVSDYDPNAVNGQVLSATNSFTVVVAAVHNGPGLPGQNNQTINELTTMVVINTATDSDIPALALSYQLAVAPAGATISSNGIIVWTPTQSQAPSTNLFTTVVSDSGTPSLSSTNSFTVVVNDLNSAPVLPVQTNLTITGLATLVVTNTAAEADIHSVSLNYSLVNGPTNAVIDANGIITWTPVMSQVPSTNVITTLVSDYDPYAVNGQVLSATNTFSVVVLAVHTGPTLPSQNNQTVNELATLEVTNTATDSDIPALALSYQLAVAPAGATISSNGIIIWTPSQSQAPSTNVFTTVVSDSGTPSLSATNSFTVVVDDLNSAPVLPVQTNFTITGLATLVVTNTAAEADIHSVSLTYSLISGPTNAVIDTNGIITWTPVASQVPSTNMITTLVSDYDPYAVNGQVLSATNTFSVVVLAVHNGPGLTSQNNQTINELATLEVTNTATDSDIPGLALSYQLAVAPVGATISSNGIIIWTPSQSQAPSTNVFTTIVSDSGTPSLSATNSFTVVVNDLNSAPVLPVQTNLTITGLATLVVTNTAAEADIHSVSLTYSLLSGPTNAVIDTNGIITWTPVASQVPSTNVITTLVSDYDPYAVNGQVLSATNSFTVVVGAVHNAPSLPSQSNRTISGLVTLVVTNTATVTDIPALALSYRLAVAPAGATISSSGIITWTPSPSQAPSTNVFTTVVTDSGTPPLSATNSFVVVVSTASFRITSMILTNSQVIITWNSVAGQWYSLQYKNSLNSTNWQSLPPVIMATGTTTTVTNALGSAPQRFYRVALAQAPTTFSIESISASNQTVTITWDSIPGQTYGLQYRNQLNATNWVDLPPQILATTTKTSATSSVAGAVQRFYRVKLVQ